MTDIKVQSSNTVSLEFARTVGFAGTATESLLGSASGGGATGSTTTAASYDALPLIAKGWGVLLKDAAVAPVTALTIDVFKTVDVVLSDLIAGKKPSVIVFDALKSEQFAQLFRDVLKSSNVPLAKVETGTKILKLASDLSVTIWAL
jgi:hypothetical protein